MPPTPPRDLKSKKDGHFCVQWAKLDWKMAKYGNRFFRLCYAKIARWHNPQPPIHSTNLLFFYFQPRCQPGAIFIGGRSRRDSSGVKGLIHSAAKTRLPNVAQNLCSRKCTTCKLQLSTRVSHEVCTDPSVPPCISVNGC